MVNYWITKRTQILPLEKDLEQANEQVEIAVKALEHRRSKLRKLEQRAESLNVSSARNGTCMLDFRARSLFDLKLRVRI